MDDDVSDLTSSWTMWAVWALWAGLWAAAAATPQPLHLERDSLRRQVPLPVTVWQKRHQAAAAQAAAAAPDELRDFQHHLDAAVNSQMMLRSPRGERQYDVPQIGKSAHGNVTWLLNPEARYKAIRCLIFPGHLIVYCRNYNAKMILLWHQKSIVIIQIVL